MSTPGCFGRVLREHRTASGVSLSALASRIFYSKGHLSRVENGLVKPSYALAMACDKEFGTAVFTKVLEEEVGKQADVPDVAAVSSSQTDRINQDFTEFYRVEKDALLAYVRANGVAPDGSAVIVQDVMMECFRRWSTLDNPLAWIRGAAKNKIFEHWRREGRRRVELGGGDPRLDAELAKLTSPSAEAEVLSDAS